MVLERCVPDKEEAGQCCLFSFGAAPSSISLLINYSLNWHDRSLGLPQAVPLQFSLSNAENQLTFISPSGS